MLRAINRMNEVVYYTLAEVVKEALGEIPATLKCGFPVAETIKDILEGILALEIPEASPVLADEVNTLFCQYIYPRHKSSFCAWIVNQKEDYETKIEVMRAFAENFISVTVSTFDKYKKLIDINEAEKARLMDPVKSSATTRNNDTPQNGGSFESDTYTSMYIHSDTETDGDTRAARIDQIARMLHNFFEDWAHEYDFLFEVSTND